MLLLLTVSSSSSFVHSQVHTLEQAEKMQVELEQAEQKVHDKMKKERGGSINEEHLWMDGLADDIEVNCPSFRYKQSIHFDPPKKQITTTVRCATCNLMKEFMIRRAQLLVLRGRKPSGAYVLEGDDDGTKTTSNNFGGKEFCEAIHELYNLRQQPNGERVWVRRFSEEEENLRSKISPEELQRSVLMSDREKLMKTHLVSASGEPVPDSDVLPVKFHTPQERRTLPCARYFLKQMCFAELGSREDGIDDCFDTILNKIDVKSAQSKNSDWADKLEQCLHKALGCEKTFCNPRVLAEVKKQEWIELAWYEGAFGNPKFSYIPDFEHKGRNLLNPYRKGGEKEQMNPWLNGTWEQQEDLSRIADDL